MARSFGHEVSSCIVFGSFRLRSALERNKSVPRVQWSAIEVMPTMQEAGCGARRVSKKAFNNDPRCACTERRVIGRTKTKKRGSEGASNRVEIGRNDNFAPECPFIPAVVFLDGNGMSSARSQRSSSARFSYQRMAGVLSMTIHAGFESGH